MGGIEFLVAITVAAFHVIFLLDFYRKACIFFGAWYPNFVKIKTSKKGVPPFFMHSMNA